jgi:phospholipid/cholesterol/gamma-HCH transport system ATP-binding protein
LKKKLKTTFIVVTHDIKSAKYVGDRIAMIYKGQIVFLGTPKELDKTKNPYVLQFVNGQSEGPITDEYNLMISKMLENNREKKV